MFVRSKVQRVAALTIAAAVILAACGGSDDADESTAPATAAEPDDDGAAEPEPEPDDAAEVEEEPAAEPAEEADDDTGDDSTEPAEEAAPTPVRGGELSFLIEAETDTWDLPSAQCVASCLVVLNAVADTLTTVNGDGAVEPYLLESYSTNEDFTVHTLTMRDGVTFHDGTPADGAAVQRNLVEMAEGLLVGTQFVDLANGTDSIVLVDDMTVEVTFARPVATFGSILASSPGTLLAPSFWDDPDRRSAMPIATGAFRMTEWSRDQQTVAEANPDYWRDGADGQPLPYLDRVTFRPVPDTSARRSIMEAGDAHVAHDSMPSSIRFWNEEWTGGLVEPAADQDVGYLLFNLSTPPFDDPRLRLAVAHCTDREEYRAFLADGAEIANGPFSPESLGHVEDPGFPEFDPDAGNAILDEIGRPDSIRYSTTTDPTNLQAAELFADMWERNCGLSVEIDQFDQAELITRALSADFGVMRWRNHGRGNPGLEIQTWHSRHAVGLATNVGRLMDPDIDQLLFDARETIEPAELDAIGQAITQVFADNVYTLWLNHNLWNIPTQPGVESVGVRTLPTGSMSPTATLGTTWVTEAWLSS